MLDAVLHSTAMHAVRSLELMVAGLSLCVALPACANLLDYDEVEIGDPDDPIGPGEGGTDAASETSADAATPDAASDAGVHETGEAADPCEAVECGTFGACVSTGGQAQCACDTGYHAVGLSCVEDEPVDPCAGVACGSNASCMNGACECDDGFEGDPESGCAQPNPIEADVRAELVAIAMAEQGFCEGTDDKPYMQYQPGFWCYDFVAWVYSQSSYPLPSPISLPAYQTGSLPTGWRPEPGDLIKFNIQHYGMVAAVSPDGSQITTIEGNVNSCVMSRSTTDADVEYYGSLDQAF
jgi:hypothetical protein